jgi:hypothetical protein
MSDSIFTCTQCGETITRFTITHANLHEAEADFEGECDCGHTISVLMWGNVEVSE